MDFWDILTLLGGLAFFLYGMHVMSNGLEKLAGGKLEKMLRRMTSNPFKSLLLGAVITIAIQSSSAMAVMLVGLVNSSIMEVGQTIGVMMGSNIGTTLTAWILSLAGIDSENFFVNLLRPESFAPIAALIGIVMIMASKKAKRRDIGGILIGFAILMYGMVFMSSSVSGLKDSPQFTALLTAFDNPMIALLASTLFTGIIQSSAATVGIIQALSLTGQITFAMAFPLILGANIGTCMTAFLSSFGVNRKAKRVVACHILIKVIGTAVVMIIFYALYAIFRFDFYNQPIGTVGIALVHTLFNIVTTILLMPFSKQIEKLSRLIIKDKSKTNEIGFIDERLLQSPSVAANEAKVMTVEMAKLAHDTLFMAVDQITNFNSKNADHVEQNEEKLDKYEDNLGTFLVKLSGKELSDDDTQRVSKLLYSIGDFERLGDHAVNILHSAREIHEKEIRFSEQAQSELKVIIDAICEILDITTQSFCDSDLELASHVEPLEQVIDGLIEEEKERHITRLQSGKCTLDLGFVLNDLLTNFERVSDHCSNLAVCLIQTKQMSFETHEYLNEIKTQHNRAFEQDFLDYENKYSLPTKA